MHLRELLAEEAATRRFAEALWLPYHRDLESAVDRHALADDVDPVAQEVPFRLDRLASETDRAWVAVDTDGGADASVADLADDDFAGFVTTDVDEAPAVFERPDRLVVGDLYVRDPYRGTGLADRLLERAAERARESGCGELALDVDVDNERALAFYEGRGFAPVRHRMVADVEEC